MQAMLNLSVERIESLLKKGYTECSNVYNVGAVRNVVQSLKDLDPNTIQWYVNGGREKLLSAVKTLQVKINEDLDFYEDDCWCDADESCDCCGYSWRRDELESCLEDVDTDARLIEKMYFTHEAIDYVVYPYEVLEKVYGQLSMVFD